MKSDSQEPTIQHVSDTAFLIAECRAMETARPDALFRDPLAAKLSGEKGKRIVAAWPTAKMTQWITAIRTIIIDDYIHGAVKRGVKTVVNLGAGLDTRPYRLKLPEDLLWIEADYPAIIDYKEPLLAGSPTHCRVERIKVDLADNAARHAFFAWLDTQSKPMLVLTEGVVPYLDNNEAGELADSIRALHDVDGWIVDYMSPSTHKYRDRSGFRKHLANAPFKFRPDDWVGFFASHGWTPRVSRYMGIEGYKLGRRAPLPWSARFVMKVMRRFTPKKKVEEMSKFAGYVLLEPADRP